jgi:hypothetical protein
MQDAGDKNPAGILPVKHNMPAAFHAPEAGANIVTGAAAVGMIGQSLGAQFQIV